MLKHTPKESSDSLDISSIRKYFGSIPGCKEIAHETTIKVISFLRSNVRTSRTNGYLENLDYKGRRNQNKIQDKNDIFRINVYYGSKSVGICHFLNGEVREIFKKCKSLRALFELVKRPPQLTYFDSQMLQLDNTNEAIDKGHLNQENNSKTLDNKVPSRITAKAQIETSRNKIDLSDIGLAILGAERDQLQERIRELEEIRGLKAQFDVDLKNFNYDRSDEAKKKYMVEVPPKSMFQVKSMLHSRDSDVISVSTTGIGTVVLYKYGNTSFTSLIPPKLIEKLDVRKRTHVPKPPVYVSIGTKKRFYIKLNNGDHYWVSCPGMSKSLKICKKEVACVAFGKKWKSFFLVFTDGSWEFGDEIPKGLKQLLYDRRGAEDLVAVTMGPKDEWFLKTKKGSTWWGGLSDHLESKISPIKNRIMFMDFGLYDSCIVEYV